MARRRRKHHRRHLGSSGCLKQNGRLKKGCKFRRGGKAVRV